MRFPHFRSVEGMHICYFFFFLVISSPGFYMLNDEKTAREFFVTLSGCVRCVWLR